MQADSHVTPDGSGETAPAGIADLRARTGLYSLLGRCLEAEADVELLHLFRGSLRGIVEEMELDLGADVMDGPEDEVLERLAEEFTGLFVAPGAVLPYRSVFETGRLFQPQADLATNAYREAGFEFRTLHSGEFADHVAVMLAFVARLLERQAGALAEGDGAAADAWEARRVRFLRFQVGPWAIGWARRARSCAQHPFYAAILDLTEQVIWTDLCQCCDEKTLRRLVKANRRPLVRPRADPEFRKASGL